jgi:hypothetical protein
MRNNSVEPCLAAWKPCFCLWSSFHEYPSPQARQLNTCCSSSISLWFTGLWFSMRSNRRRSHRAHLVHTDLRRRSRRQLCECSRRQDSAVLEHRRFGSYRLSARQFSGLQMPRPNRRNALRNRARKNRFLGRTDLRGWSASGDRDLPVATRNCPYRTRRRGGEFGVTLDRRHRSPRFVWRRVHMRQRVTQVLAEAPIHSACSTRPVPIPLSKEDNRSPRSCESVNVSRYFALVANTMYFEHGLAANNLVDQVASLRSLPLMSGEKIS